MWFSLGTPSLRDEKGNETVRRSSHLKTCRLKDKVATMVPEADEYKQFGRNTKLLLHPKEVTDLQFSPVSEKKGEIPPKVEISMVTVVNQEIPDSTDLTSRSGEISPENTVKRLVTNACSKYIVDCMGDSKKTSEISSEATVNEESENLPENRTWFQKPVICVSKWSKTLKMGVIHSMGLDTDHTASINQGENDKHAFSFFFS